MIKNHPYFEKDNRKFLNTLVQKKPCIFVEDLRYLKKIVSNS